MAITVVSGTPSGTNGSAPAPNIPSTPQAGDVLLYIFVSREATDGTMSMPAAWTSGNGQQLVNERGSGGCVGAWAKYWESGDTAPTITLGGHTTGTSGDSAIAIIDIIRPSAGKVLRFVDASIPSYNSASSTQVGPIDGDSLAVAADGYAMVISQHCETATAQNGPTTDDGLTWEILNNLSNTSGADNALKIWGAPSNNVAISDKTITVVGSGGAAVGAGFMLFFDEVDPPVLRGNGAKLAAVLSAAWLSGYAVINHSDASVVEIVAETPSEFTAYTRKQFNPQNWYERPFRNVRRSSVTEGVVEAPPEYVASARRQFNPQNWPGWYFRNFRRPSTAWIVPPDDPPFRLRQTPWIRAWHPSYRVQEYSLEGVLEAVVLPPPPGDQPPPLRHRQIRVAINQWLPELEVIYIRPRASAYLEPVANSWKVPYHVIESWRQTWRAQRAKISIAWEFPETAPPPRRALSLRQVILQWQQSWPAQTGAKNAAWDFIPEVVDDPPPKQDFALESVAPTWSVTWRAQRAPLNAVFDLAEPTPEDPPPKQDYALRQVLGQWTVTWGAQSGARSAAWDFTPEPVDDPPPTQSYEQRRIAASWQTTWGAQRGSQNAAWDFVPIPPPDDPPVRSKVDVERISAIWIVNWPAQRSTTGLGWHVPEVPERAIGGDDAPRWWEDTHVKPEKKKKKRRELSTEEKLERVLANVIAEHEGKPIPYPDIDDDDPDDPDDQEAIIALT